VVEVAHQFDRPFLEGEFLRKVRASWLRMTSGIVLLNLETILKEEELARRELDEESLDPLCVDDHSDDAKREE